MSKQDGNIILTRYISRLRWLWLKHKIILPLTVVHHQRAAQPSPSLDTEKNSTHFSQLNHISEYFRSISKSKPVFSWVRCCIHNDAADLMLSFPLSTSEFLWLLPSNCFSLIKENQIYPGILQGFQNSALHTCSLAALFRVLYKEPAPD